jgi:hypothetical protein
MKIYIEINTRFLTLLKNPKDLRKLMMKAINEGLEGLVLKDAKVRSQKIFSNHFFFR